MKYALTSISTTAQNIPLAIRAYRLLMSLIMGLLLVLSTPNAQADDTLSTRSATSRTHLKTIIVDNYQPYTFLNDKGDPDGFSVDIARAVAQTKGLDLEIAAGEVFG